MFDAIHEVFRFGTFRDEFEVLNAAANRDAELVRVNQSSKCSTAALARGCFREKIFVAAEHYAANIEHLRYAKVILATDAGGPRLLNLPIT
jgi:hypothetical protein